MFNELEEEFLRGNDLGRICTVDREGYPHCVRVDFVYHDGQLFIGSQAPRIWHKHISGNPKVAFEIDRLEGKDKGVFDYRGLLLKGEARKLQDSVAKEEAMKRLRQRHPAAPFGENPIVITILPKKRYRWGPWEKVQQTII